MSRALTGTAAEKARRERTKEVRMSLWFGDADLENIDLIRETFRQTSKTAAIRCALAMVALMARAGKHIPQMPITEQVA